MQRVFALIVLIALLAAVLADCDANLSGGNNASPARRFRTSSSCDANLSGDNNASPGRLLRTAVCNGKGGCVNGVCVCNPGFQGENCEIDCSSTVAPTVQLTPQPTTQEPVTTQAPTTTCPPCPCGEANLSGDNNASPARRFRRNSDACPVCNACPTTAAPTTSAPPVQLTPQPTTAAPTTTVAPTTTCPPCPCGEANLSGDNNASPARRLRRNSDACPVCNACPTTTTAAPTTTTAPPVQLTPRPTTTVAPTTQPPCWTCPAGFVHWYDTEATTAPGGDRCACVPQSTTAAPTTSAPPVQLTPKPTTKCPVCPCGETNLSGDNNASPARNGPDNACPSCAACPTTKTPSQNESGDDNARAASSAAHVTAFTGLIVAIIVSLMM